MSTRRYLHESLGGVALCLRCHTTHPKRTLERPQRRCADPPRQREPPLFPRASLTQRDQAASAAAVARNAPIVAGGGGPRPDSGAAGQRRCSWRPKGKEVHAHSGAARPRLAAPTKPRLRPTRAARRGRVGSRRRRTYPAYPNPGDDQTTPLCKRSRRTRPCRPREGYNSRAAPCVRRGHQRHDDSATVHAVPRARAAGNARRRRHHASIAGRDRGRSAAAVVEPLIPPSPCAPQISARCVTATHVPVRLQ